MAKGIEIGIASETRAFKQGIETGMIKPLENAVDALDDLGKSKGPDQLEAGMRDAQNATEKLQKETKQTADTIEREYRDAYRKSKTASKDGTDKMSDNVGEFKNEAIANFSEVASSFSGDISDMADGVQGLTGGLASALTPGIGIPLAILGAAAGAFLASWTQSSEDSSARIASMYDDMLESGQRYLSENFIQEEIAKIGQGAEDAAGSYEGAMKSAAELGISTQTILRAMVGDQQAIADVVDATNRKRQEEIGALGTLDSSTRDYADKVDAVNLKADDTIKKWQQISIDTDTAAAKAATVGAAFSSGNALLDAQLTKIQNVAAALDGIGDKTIKINADTTGLDGILAGLQGRNISVNANGQIIKIGQMVW